MSAAGTSIRASLARRLCTWILTHSGVRYSSPPETKAKMRIRYLPGLAIAVLTAIPVAWASLQAQKPAPGPQTAVAPIDFVRDIQPILQNTCYECHGPKKTKADLRLDSPAGIMKGGETGAIIVAGNSERSLIVRRVLGLDDEDRMPKDGIRFRPRDCAIALDRSGRSWPGAGRRGASEELNRLTALGVSAA